MFTTQLAQQLDGLFAASSRPLAMLLIDLMYHVASCASSPTGSQDALARGKLRSSQEMRGARGRLVLQITARLQANFPFLQQIHSSDGLLRESVLSGWSAGGRRQPVGDPTRSRSSWERLAFGSRARRRREEQLNQDESNRRLCLCKIHPDWFKAALK